MILPNLFLYGEDKTEQSKRPAISTILLFHSSARHHRLSTPFVR